MKELKYKVGDRFKNSIGTLTTIHSVSDEGLYTMSYNGNPGMEMWEDCEIDKWEKIPNPLECAGGATEKPCKQEPDHMDPIVSMLITTNLASRLGLPEPYEVDMEWDSPEYLLWILYRADSLAPKEPK